MKTLSIWRPTPWWARAVALLLFAFFVSYRWVHWNHWLFWPAIAVLLASCVLAMRKRQASC